jgi:putative Holliday junction resolvase
MSFLWIDFWLKRIGLAYTIEDISFPYETIERVNIFKELKKVIQAKNIEKIVIGWPEWYENNKKLLEKIEVFIDSINNFYPQIEVIKIDERYTTNQSLKLMGEQFRDSYSAQLILDTYLIHLKNGLK